MPLAGWLPCRSRVTSLSVSFNGSHAPTSRSSLTLAFCFSLSFSCAEPLRLSRLAFPLLLSRLGLFSRQPPLHSPFRISLHYLLPLPLTAPLTHIDDEYANAGIEDPRVLITTSRDPSSKLAQFAKVRPSSRRAIGKSRRRTTLTPPSAAPNSRRKCASASPTRHASTEETTS